MRTLVVEHFKYWWICLLGSWETTNIDQFVWYFQWQIDLQKRKRLRAWQKLSIVDFLKKQRWFWVLFAAVVALFFTAWLMSGWPFELDSNNPITVFRKQLNTSPANTGAWSFLTIISGAFIAFALWKFRDTNMLWQIENQRKDTNLKDFQKLAEWANGLHLVEDKETKTAKAVAGDKATTESTTSIETTKPPAHITLDTITRREGSVSLQISAISQLQAFLRGDYGPQFKEPAFVLLKFIWLAIVQRHVSGDSGNELQSDSAPQWVQSIKTETNTELAKTITMALASQYGNYFRDHSQQLPNICLTGLNTSLTGLQPLELDGLNLAGIQFQGAFLPMAQFQGADLNGGKLQGVELESAQLQSANLRSAQLQYANLSKAWLQQADLSKAKLQETNLANARLYGANLNLADLQDAFLLRATLQKATLLEASLRGAALRQAQLQGACFVKTELENTELTNIEIDSETNFHFSTTDLHTEVRVISYSEKKENVVPTFTHALRLKLLDKNGLKLVAPAYTEYLEQWNALEKTEQDRLYKIAGTETAYKEIRAMA